MALERRDTVPKPEVPPGRRKLELGRHAVPRNSRGKARSAAPRVDEREVLVARSRFQRVSPRSDRGLQLRAASHTGISYWRRPILSDCHVRAETIRALIGRSRIVRAAPASAISTHGDQGAALIGDDPITLRRFQLHPLDVRRKV